MQGGIFLQLPSHDDFVRAAQGHTEKEYLDGLLVQKLTKIATYDYIETMLGMLCDQLEINQNAALLRNNQRNALFRDALNDDGNRVGEREEEVVLGEQDLPPQAPAASPFTLRA